LGGVTSFETMGSPTRDISVAGWEVEWIELLKADVTAKLCPAGERGKTVQKASKERSTPGRTRPAAERVLDVLRQLFPQGPPEQAILPNKTLCKQVGERLKAQDLPRVSDDTILRAAGRRERK
jgi:hypothetical protein